VEKLTDGKNFNIELNFDFLEVCKIGEQVKNLTEEK